MGWSVGRSGDVIVSASDSKEAEGEKEMSSASFDDDDIRDRSKEPAATVIAPAHSLPFRVNAVLIGSMSVAVDDTTAAKCRPHRPRVDPSRAESRRCRRSAFAVAAFRAEHRPEHRRRRVCRYPAGLPAGISLLFICFVRFFSSNPFSVLSNESYYRQTTR